MVSEKSGNIDPVKLEERVFGIFGSACSCACCYTGANLVMSREETTIMAALIVNLSLTLLRSGSVVRSLLITTPGK